MKTDKQNVSDLNAIDRRITSQKEKAKTSLGMVSVSGGYQISIEELVGADLRPEWIFVKSPFANERDLLKEPNPDCQYVWRVFDRNSRIKGDVTRSDALFQGIRKGWYRLVQVDELKDEVDIPYSSVDLFNGRDPGNGDAVVLKGLVLVELSKQAYDFEYRQRVLQAAMNSDPAVGLNILQNSMANLGVKNVDQVTSLKTD